MKKHFIHLLFLCFVNTIYAQISSPGLGKANTASWFAVGVEQQLDTIKNKNWKSMTYVGAGRKSNPDTNNPFYKPAIFVVNQEFYNQFHNNWQYSFALSYRKQNEYSDSFPYEEIYPKSTQEIRLYGRFSYIFKTDRLKLTPTFRQEFRRFFTPDFTNAEDIFQLRTRFRLQLSINLDADKHHKLTFNSEQLFSISKETAQWSDFNYRESRFSLYYSYSPIKMPVTFSLGYMKNIVGTKNTYNVDYFAFDMVFKNLL